MAVTLQVRTFLFEITSNPSVYLKVGTWDWYWAI